MDELADMVFDREARRYPKTSAYGLVRFAGACLDVERPHVDARERMRVPVC